MKKSFDYNISVSIIIICTIILCLIVYISTIFPWMNYIEATGTIITIVLIMDIIYEIISE